MSRRRGRDDYIPLSQIDDDQFTDAQFAGPAKKVPWKAIWLATILCFGGTVLLITGSLIVSGHINSKYGDRMWPVIILGALMFIPGAYHVRIAFYAMWKVPGYSYDDIPEFE